MVSILGSELGVSEGDGYNWELGAAAAEPEPRCVMVAGCVRMPGKPDVVIPEWKSVPFRVQQLLYTSNF